jgi:predicted branched-subunit amino acid permease
MTKYTDSYVGALFRQAADKVVPAVVATYTAGFIFGQFVHSLNSKLAQVVK